MGGDTGAAAGVTLAKWGLVASVVLALLALGAVHPGSRAAVHSVLGLALFAAATIPQDVLCRSAGMGRVVLASAMVWTAQLISLMNSRDVEATVGALADSWLWIGAAVGTVVVAATSRRGSALYWPWVVGGAGVALLGAAHVFFGMHSVLGVFEPMAAPVRFWAPFVNPNHFGALMLMAFPVALGAALGRGGTARRGTSAGLAAVIFAAVMASGSGLPPLILGLQAVVLGAMVWRPMALIGLVALPVAVPFAMVWAGGHGGSVSASLANRWMFWRTGGAALLESPLVGVGAGAFNAAVGPLREDVRFVSWMHAHNDGIEWLVETGLVGAVAIVAAVVVLAPWRLGGSRFLVRLAVGLGGLGLFAMGDFPLQIPALAMVAAVGVAWCMAVRKRSKSAPVVWVRVALVSAALAQLAGAAWQARTWAADRAAQRLWQDPGDMEADGWLASLAPWAPDRAIADIRRQSGAAQACSKAHDAVTTYPGEVELLAVAIRAWIRCGEHDKAMLHAEELVELTPWNPRSWGLRALAHTAKHPADAVGAWGDAIRAGVPGAMEAGWAILPEGLYWADAVEDASVGARQRTASFLLRRGEPAAAGSLLDSILLQQPDRVLRDAPAAMLAVGRDEDACAYMDRLWASHSEDAWVRRRRPEVLEACGRWADARDGWLVNYRAGAFGLGDATRCEVRLEGVDAGRQLWEEHTTLGRRVTDRDRVMVARTYAEAGALADCRSLLLEGGFRDPVLAREATALKRRCGAGL